MASGSYSLFCGFHCFHVDEPFSRQSSLLARGIEPSRRVAADETSPKKERPVYFDAVSLVSIAIASCTVDMNWAGKMIVEFFSTEISAIVCNVRS